ncbi:glycine/sarcosine/betaine reductase selenoprotein B family protein [Planococcus sp. YIM B11945]|uniref:glycine/sarcosine/betaine reductase selenoprotein B family protein n=1 Tax=Planococcus sp. YIM B11945 TaxID=3435410 RepID=UPI003D7E63C9
MKTKTRIKSKLSRTFSSNFPEAYKKFTMSHMKENQDIPATHLTKPLNECKVALLSTAGVHLKTDAPFDVDNPAGDHTFRLIPGSTKEDELTVTHIYIDTKYAKADPSIVFPLGHLRLLAKNGTIESLADTNIGLNGGILDTALAEKESIPQVVNLLRNEAVDLALLVPG